MAGNRPDSADVHVNALLTNLSIAYKNEAYISERVFPVIPVNKQSDIVPRYDKAVWFRDEMAARAPGTKAAESGWTVDNTMTYFCDSFALRKLIPDEVRANQDEPYDMDRDAVSFLTDKALMKRERDFATTVVGSSIWTTTGTIGAKWSDYANSDPIDDILATKRAIVDLIGREPNTLVCGKIVRDRLLRHPDLLDIVKYTQRGILSEELLAQAFGLQRLFTIIGVYESAVEGATSSMAAIVDDDAVLLFVPPAPSLLTPAAGYTFVWRPMTGGAAQYIRRYRLEEETTDVIEVRSYFDIKVTSADAGAVWQDCVD